MLRWLLLIFACWVSQTAIAGSITAYNSYLIPPFLDATQRGGLAPDLVDYLNRELAPAYRLQLQNLPRARLEKLVLKPQGENFSGVALFLHPAFVGDAEQRRYLWSRPLMGDRNLLVFRAPLERQIDNLDSLNGMRFSGIYSHRYAGLDERVKAGVLQREDAADEALNLAKVVARRVDFTLLNQSNFMALLQRHQDYSKTLVALPVPWQKPFNRYILVGRQHPELLHALDQVISGMANDARWQQIAEKYSVLPPH